ncbi:CYTH domain-containing protein [Aquisalimonas lutea]|uniref:CYTH domain-containing protein n=1 Tax=Aquisalimonas lutea TaxID=1327750 RepID=UPI0025B4CD65|nr:CYTH domain-containing protein [Aquisalimonas lutea]MDN3518625.1 CYTH domain-containing protein [Aquisalimonas lutea]
MAAEIERKFLVNGDAWRADVDRSMVVRQGYFGGTERASIRVRVSDDRAWLNIKSATLGISRQEYEYEIPLDDAEEMLAGLCQGPLIEKTRHYVRYAGHLWEIDEFFGDNAGLVVAELELSDADEPFQSPGWLGAEVSDDPRYYNVRLAQHPYREWS